MRNRGLRVPRTLLVTGLVFMIIGGGLLWRAEAASSWQGILWIFTPPVAYAFVGWAWWQWAGFTQANAAAERLLRRTSLMLSAASVIVSAGYFVSLYQLVHFRIHSPGADPYYRSGVAGESAEALGLCLAAFGFWLGSNGVSRSGPDPGADDAPDDLAPVNATIA